MPLKKHKKRLQYLLNEISMCAPTDAKRFMLLKNKAKKALKKMREEYPDLRTFPLRGTDTDARRGPDQSPAGGAPPPQHG